MAAEMLFDTEPEPCAVRYQLTPRPYQHDALDKCFELFRAGTPGALLRIFTGGGKTITTAMIADRWLSQGEDYRVMVVSYEKQLVWQFAQELKDVLGIVPGIEMESERITPGRVPRVTVASRASLVRSTLATEEQKQFLIESGVDKAHIGLCRLKDAIKLIRAIRSGAGVDFVTAELRDINESPLCDHKIKAVSRLHKFDWRFNWLVAWDEAHKHTQQLTTVGHVVEWFERNPKSRRLGMTATPKRSDGVSIGSKMFPGVAIDYPLQVPDRPCAVRDGFAVPYVQKFIKVHAIDFGDIKKLCGDATSKWDAEVSRRLEEQLATVCEPLLDLVEDRRTLIFSPTVSMAQGVERYINARVKCRCQCGYTQWHAPPTIEDGALCRKCNRPLSRADILKTAEMQARSVWGEIPASDRQDVYAAHQSGGFQFLSVCGLCREGYNDPDISCVAVFRPVSRKASSLAEQMKGRGSRPLRGLIEGMQSAEERLAAIASSEKPNCLIVDLVGITGLGDCATTVQIYAEGLEDVIVDRAEALVLGGVEDVQQAIRIAMDEQQRKREEAKRAREERERAARETAKRRAEARARVQYEAHDVGNRSSGKAGMATDKQLNFIHSLGMQFEDWEPTSKQAGRIITQLKEGTPREQVAYLNGIKEGNWKPTYATSKQRYALQKMGVKVDPNMSKYEASQLFDSRRKGFSATPEGPTSAAAVVELINDAQSSAELDRIKADLKRTWTGYSTSDQSQIIAAGRERRRLVDVPF